MPRLRRISILSDIHYAGPGEQARGEDYELRAISPAPARWLLRWYRHHVWLRYPLRQNYLLDDFIRQAPESDWVIGNGDYNCDTAFVGLSDAASLESTQLCLERLRGAYADRLQLIPGDHEFGKVSILGHRGGMRVASWSRLKELKIEPAWKLVLGRYSVVGVTSSIVGLPVFERDVLASEMDEWQAIRTGYLHHLEQLLASIPESHRILLFCHDPTALPWLLTLDHMRRRLAQVEQTIIGHLHSNLILGQSRLLSGMPRISCFGTTVHRLSSALREARKWKAFRVRLCPSLAGVELLKDGGFLSLELSEDASEPIRWTRHRLPRRKIALAAERSRD